MPPPAMNNPEIVDDDDKSIVHAAIDAMNYEESRR